MNCLAKHCFFAFSMACQHSSSYCPELNPAERVWEYLKDLSANKVFNSLEELSCYVKQMVMELTKERVMSITSYDWIMEIINAQLIT
jgi:hypothetical protein